MKANDSDFNWQFNRQDFEDFFVKHLSTGNNHQGFNLFSDSLNTVSSGYRAPVHTIGGTSTVVQRPSTQAYPVNTTHAYPATQTYAGTTTKPYVGTTTTQAYPATTTQAQAYPASTVRR